MGTTFSCIRTRVLKPSNRYTDGMVPASLYQVGSYGSCLSALSSKMICAMEGNFTSKGAPRMGEVKHFQPGTHINQQVSENLAASPPPLETCLRIHTWRSDWRAVLIGVCHQACRDRWHRMDLLVLSSSIGGIQASTGTLSVIAKEDLLTLHQKRGAVGATLHALGLDPDRLPTKLDPSYQHVQAANPSAQHVDHQQSMMALIKGDEPPFTLPRSKQQACPPSGLLSGLPSASSSLPASVARSSTEAAAGAEFSSLSGVLVQNRPFKRGL